jgi:hypothetical protein
VNLSEIRKTEERASLRDARSPTAPNIRDPSALKAERGE